MTVSKIAVLGGGNASHTISADLTLKGLSVNLFGMERFADSMRTVFETGEIEMSGVAGSGKARLNMVTSDIAQAVAGVEVLLWGWLEPANLQQNAHSIIRLKAALKWIATGAAMMNAHYWRATRFQY